MTEQGPVVPPPLPAEQATKQKLTPTAHILCGWPLVMIAFGGAIGGGLGGVAYALNVAIYRSRMPVVVKILLNLLVGCAAFVLWLVLAALISVLMHR